MDCVKEDMRVKKLDYPLTDDRNECKNKSVVPTPQNREKGRTTRKSCLVYYNNYLLFIYDMVLK